MRNALGSTGFITASDDSGRWHFAGTCFAIRTPRHFLTVAHNVKGVSVDRLGVSIYPHIDSGLVVEAIHVHPTADLALVITEDWAELNLFDPFLGIDEGDEPGGVVSAFGYPNQTFDSGIKPVPRHFRGNIQRAFEHTSKLGYAYVALELSFGSPAGLSGGPVSLAHSPSNVIGVMAENYQASTYVHTIQEVITPTETHRETQHDFVNYGIAVRLSECQDWVRRVLGDEEAGA